MDVWTAFVTARLDEDEAVARRNIGDSGLRDRDWSTSPGWPDYQTYSGDDLDAAGDYIDRFRPLRALREVAAMRAIVQRYKRESGILVGVLRDLATIWSDHPDYPGRS